MQVMLMAGMWCVSDGRSVPMTVKVIPEHAVLREAAEVWLQHLSPAKVARFWAAWQGGGGSYPALRDHRCAGETVTTLFENGRTSQEERQEP
jgi:hypothetical protein